MFKFTSRLLSGWALMALGTLAASGLLIAWLAPAAAEQPLGSDCPAADKGEQLRQQAGDLVRRAARPWPATTWRPPRSWWPRPKRWARRIRCSTAATRRRPCVGTWRPRRRPSGPARPSLLATPGNVKKAPTTDPFMGRVGGSILPGPNEVTPLPKVEPSPVRLAGRQRSEQRPFPFGRAGGALPGTGDVWRSGRPVCRSGPIPPPARTGATHARLLTRRVRNCVTGP